MMVEPAQGPQSGGSAAAAAPPQQHAGPVTGATALVAAARQLGARVCFANPGTTEMWLVHALDAAPGVHSVLCLHETVCTGAADGWARMARVPALTLLHLGPGLANGLANLHNARRADSAIVNLVGDMATWHAASDAPLCSDIAALAATVSKCVITNTSAERLPADFARCLDAAMTAEEPGGSRISTLIIPHDSSWAELPTLPQSTALPPPVAACLEAVDGVEPFLGQCAAAIKHAGAKCALLLGGEALLAEGGALEAAGRIAAATGAALLAPNAFARIDRGVGLPLVQRLPYFPDAAAKQLACYTTLVTVDARLPVAMFGYRDGLSELVALGDEHVWQLDVGALPAAALLQRLAAAVGGSAIVPGANCRGRFVMQERRPPLPKGKLTGAALCAAVAALQPPGAIIVDESITAGGSYWDVSARCPQFSHLTLTGGAIGCGPPLALGAALACPDRTIINLQADGSAMYSLQALWSQAREQAHVITIICANRSYEILKVEQMKQRIPGPPGTAGRRLTDIGTPALDFVALARGMGVPAERVATVEELAAALAAALARGAGPHVIEAVLQ